GSGGFPAPGIDSYEDTLATAEAMNRLGESAVDAGFEKFFGHNHDQEFTTTYEHDGQVMSAWEILVAETDPQYVTFEVDVAWRRMLGLMWQSSSSSTVTGLNCCTLRTPLILVGRVRTLPILVKVM